MGAIRQSVAQGLTAVQLLYSQSAAYAAKKEEAAAKAEQKRRSAEYKRASEALDPAIESSQEELNTKQGNIEHIEDIAKPQNLREDTEATIYFNREAEIAAEVLGGLQQKKAQAALKAGEYKDFASATTGARETEYARSGHKQEQVKAEQGYQEYLDKQKMKYLRAQQRAKQDIQLESKKNKIELYNQYGEVIR